METRRVATRDRRPRTVEIRLHEIWHGDSINCRDEGSPYQVEIRLHEIGHGDDHAGPRLRLTPEASRSGSMRSGMETRRYCVNAVEIRLHEIGHGD
jgi:hypothetical protein